MGLYDRYLAARIRMSDAALPDTVALVITERDLLEAGAYRRLERFLHLAVRYGTERVVVYVSVLDEAAVATLRSELEGIRAPRAVAIRDPADDVRADAPIQISIGLGGKHEFAIAVRSLAGDVEAGTLATEEVEESEIEERLVFPTAPDLVVKTGAERLSDFMIWQSVYSELYFTDVNWRDFRDREYLRALRDFQERQRRFGE